MRQGMPTLFLISDRRSETIWSALYQQFFLRFRFPTTLLSDNAIEFSSEKFNQYALKVGIQPIFSAPYHPRANRTIESFHQLPKRLLSPQKTLPAESLVTSALYAY
eukprot:GHVP01040310.1.p1 GENE.GHVP01040310.1~~GHVP01040310.1.p1  ORF type:complete len:106 (-),score=4.75 GHVP01040310.1:153-470(-)